MTTFQRASSAARTISLRPRHDLHLLRKAWHIGTGCTGLLIYYFLDITPLAMGLGLVVFAAVGLILENIRIRSERLNQMALSLLGPFMRESERHQISGMPFYALGVGLSLLLFEEKLAILSICFLIFSDPIASVAGVTLGRDKILPNKSLQGAVAGFCVCYILSLAYAIYFGAKDFELLYFAVGAGLIGMASEIVSAFGIDDNLSIPVLSGFGLTLLNLLFPIFQ